MPGAGHGGQKVDGDPRVGGPAILGRLRGLVPGSEGLQHLFGLRLNGSPKAGEQRHPQASHQVVECALGEGEQRRPSLLRRRRILSRRRQPRMRIRRGRQRQGEVQIQEAGLHQPGEAEAPVLADLAGRDQRS